MKKLIFAAGFLSTISVTVGMVLRATLGTNASGDLNKILISIGFGGLAIVFIPGLLASQSSQSGDKTSLRVLMVSSLLLGMGWIFKLLHITSANELVLLGTAILIFGFLPLVFIKMYKASTLA